MKNIKLFLTLTVIICSIKISIGQVNLGLINLGVVSAGNVATVSFTPVNALPAGQFISAINIFFRTSQTDFVTTSVQISTTYNLTLISDWDNGDGNHWWYYQGQPSTPTSNWPVGISQTIATFTVEGTNGLTLANFGNDPIRNFWPGPAATIGDDNLVNWPISVFAPLPITLKSFDAIKHSASSAKLDWTTSKEVNSDYFGIERSIDGSTWDEIARVKAAGDSNVDIAYDYIDDRLPLSRTNGQVFYYRLRMTDLDGAFKYSDVRGVNFDKQALGPISIYPNPTTEIVNIDLSEVVMEDGDVYVSVYDMSGRLVMTKQIIGSGIELIKVDQLPSDAYNFIIRQGEQIHQQRVIKID